MLALRRPMRADTFGVLADPVETTTVSACALPAGRWRTPPDAQDIVQALKVANHVYCLQEGRVALSGEAKTMTRERISKAYFGV